MQNNALGCSNIVTLARDLVAIVEAKLVGCGKPLRVSSLPPPKKSFTTLFLILTQYRWKYFEGDLKGVSSWKRSPHFVLTIAS